MALTSNDAAHFFFAFPVFVYATILLFEHFRVFRIIHRHSEAIFIIILSIPIFIADFVSYVHCKGWMCAQINIMHCFFGVFMFLCGIMGILQERSPIWRGIPKLMSPLVLCAIGFFMTLHEQGSDYGAIIHQAFGGAALLTAILRHLSFENPEKYQVLASFSAMIMALLFVMGSDSSEAFWSTRMNGHNVLFLVICVCTAWLIIIMSFINWKLGGQLENGWKQLDNNANGKRTKTAPEDEESLDVSLAYPMSNLKERNKEHL
eukprot:TRINITY_DN1652_c0_g1_i3.p1 TRINITY_DN1652_c0_g1~~TRINITY_DN1652_c0_g1_i3.p1  ORF type:complete len:262 (+),score=61.33 TRINITY_DN1652_c0_g1_i3:173-958(+)